MFGERRSSAVREAAETASYSVVMTDAHDAATCTKPTQGRLMQSLEEMEEFFKTNPFHLHLATPYNHGTPASNDTTDGPQWVTYCKD